MDMRNRNLDLVKWLAMAAMVIDHLRYIPLLAGYSNFWLMVGRFAFPFFCLTMAANVIRPNARSSPYIWKLLIFALLSELPYRFYVGAVNAHCFNILPTLLLGLLLCLIIFKVWSHSVQLALLILIGTVAVWMNGILMYGAVGILLPMSFAMTLKHGLKWLWLPVLVAAVATYQYFYPDFSWSIFGVVFCAAIAPAVGIYLLKRPLRSGVKPVTWWGYWFYPLHFMVLYFIRSIIH